MQIYLDYLKTKNLIFKIVDQFENAVIIEIDVWAKPGAKMDKVFVSAEGVLSVSTRAKPIDGEANTGICTVIADTFGLSGAKVQLIKGEKSRQKKIRLLIEVSTSKKIDYYRKKLDNL